MNEPSETRSCLDRAERRGLEVVRLILTRIANGDQNALRKAMDNIARLENTPNVDPFYPREWRRILTLPLDEALAEALAESDCGAMLRHGRPFGGILTATERMAIWRKHSGPDRTCASKTRQWGQATSGPA